MENAEKKKILYIITLPDWGGAQHYIFNLSYNLKDEFIITVATGKSSGLSKFDLLKKIEEYMPDKKVGIYQFENLVRSINPMKDFLAVFELAKYIDSVKPDIIHLNSSKAGIISSFAARLAKHKPKIVYTVHGWVFLEPMSKLKKWLYTKLEKCASRWRDKIIVLGEKEKQIALKNKICPEKKMEVIPHGIDRFRLQSKDVAREKFGLPKDKKIIGTIANFYPAKGLNYLIEAAAQINNPDILFCIIGDGPLRTELEEKRRQLSLEQKFKMPGEFFYAAQYLNAFDVFVLPSVKEGMPFAILEAMGAGLPIVATDIGNIQEMMADYQNKIIIPPKDTAKLSQAILEIKHVPTIWNPRYGFYFNIQMKNFYDKLFL